MKLFKNVELDPTKRRYECTEFIVSIVTLIPVFAFGWFCDPRLLSLIISLISDAYIISRSVMKMNRESLRYWGATTTEFKALLISQILVMLAGFRGLPFSWIVSLLTANTMIYSICRGLVKKTPYKVRHQVINL
jgi:hypothetical protein